MKAETRIQHQIEVLQANARHIQLQIDGMFRQPSECLNLLGRLQELEGQIAMLRWVLDETSPE